MKTKNTPKVKIKLKNPADVTNKKIMKLTETARRIVAEYENKQNPVNRMTKFQVPKPLPGTEKNSVMVNDANTVFDDSSLPINNCGEVNTNQIEKLTNSWFMGYPVYSILSQNGILQNIIQSFAQNCTREWIDIKTRDNSTKKSKASKISQIHKCFEELEVEAHYYRAMEMTIMFGGCKLYHKLKGDDKTDESGSEYLTPLYIKDKVNIGDLLYLKVIEPLYATPLNFNSTNPLSEYFYVPKEWNCLGNILHESRLCHFNYNYVPTLLKPVYWFYGMPLIQLVLSYLIGFESIRKDIVNVVSRYNINVFKTSLDALLNYDGTSTFQDGQDALSRLKLAQALATNFSIFALDNNPEAPEEWQQFNMTIAGLSDILSQNAELVCAVCREPAIILYGTSPKGFNSTGDVELRVFYDLIANLQKTIMLPNLRITFNLVQMHLFGEIDDDLFIEFKPLWTLSELEQSQVQSNKYNGLATLFNANLIAWSEAREVLKNDPESGFNNLMSDDEFDALMSEYNYDQESQQEEENQNSSAAPQN